MFLYKCIILCVYVVLLAQRNAEAVENVPAVFASSVWTDVSHGDISFGTTTMSDWSFTVSGDTTSEWDCVMSSTFDTDGTLAFVTSNTFSMFVTQNYYAYLCLKMTKVTDYSYRYYIYSPIQNSAGGERILIYPFNTLTDTAIICNEEYAATDPEYGVMVKSDNVLAASIHCPYVFLGSYDLVHTTWGDVTTCESDGNEWSMCSDTKQMTFDTGLCPTKVAHSDSAVYCVDTVPVGTDNFITVYNPGSVDNSNTYRFTCFGVSADGTTASIAPNNCRRNQSPTTFPVDNNFKNIGATMTMPITYETCPLCPTLAVPDGGTLSVETNGAVTTATYACDDGFDIYGDSTRTCQDDTTWTGTDPSCKCLAPDAPVNGSVTVLDSGVMATYACDVGFVLNGEQYRYCSSIGNIWNGTEPTCFECESLPDPVAGTVSLAVNDTTTEATYLCNDGYNMNGADTRQCQTDGSWAGVAPTCVCETLTAPANGTVDDSDGMAAYYTCDAGFTLQGDKSRYCQTDGGSWNGSAPTCEQCSTLNNLTNGDTVVTSDGEASTATFTCDAKYTLSGSTSSTCQTGGSWIPASLPECVECGLLANISSGTVDITTDGQKSTASYTCATELTDGYYLDVDSPRTCLIDGSWTGVEPTCYCNAPADPFSGAVSLSGDQTTATYTCTQGYTLSGNTSRVCQQDGSGWDGADPSCVSCGSPSLPFGATTQEYTTGTETRVLVSCQVGYSMNGTALLSCTSEGSWDNPVPDCVQCVGALIETDSLTLVSNTDGVTTSVLYTCAKGYSMNGDRQRNCLSDGSYDIDAPTCAECAILTDPDSGQVSTSTNGTSTIAHYQCASGYYLVGEQFSVCSSFGSYSPAAPTCVCDPPPTPANGTVLLSTDGNEATYSCTVGYTLDSAETRACQTDGTGWAGDDPTCVLCVTLAPPSNGETVISTNGTVTSAAYLCDVGYTISGPVESACQASGAWGTTTTSCTLCDPQSNPDSGSFTQNTTGTVTYSTFTCVDGYELIGAGTLTCDENGAWDILDPPVCACVVPDSVANGNVTVSSDRTTVSYTCDSGYILVGVASRTCQGGGQSWTDSGIDTTCDPCATLSDPTSGNYTITTDGTVSTTTYLCDLGYSISGVTSRTCQLDGSWSGAAPDCVQCTSLPDPSSSTAIVASNGWTNTITYTCADGYDLTGDASRTCGSNGQWNGTEPVCSCQTPNISQPLNSTGDATTITYWCEGNYILSGSAVRTCKTDGTGWSGSDPSCTLCEAIQEPNDGSMILASDGSVTTATFDCDPGATMNGTQILICIADGTWDGDAPTCVACTVLSDPESGNFTYTDTATVSIVEFACADGYDLIGATTSTCQLDGTWDNVSPTCLCTEPAVPSNGNMEVSDGGYKLTYTCATGYTLDGAVNRTCQTDGSGWDFPEPSCAECATLGDLTGGTKEQLTDGTTTTTNFTCDAGYTLLGQSTLSCDSTGAWDTSQPTCEECPAVSDPDSGSVLLTTDGHTSSATYTCVGGYKILGNASKVCQTDGTWDSTTPTCVCVVETSPDNGLVSVSDDGMTLTQNCSVGYTLLGVTTRVCQSNGAGWNEALHSCTQCLTLANVDGGTVALETDGAVTSAVYTCNTRYTMSGSSTISCRTDGTWMVESPTCTFCDDIQDPLSGTVAFYTDGTTTSANFTCSGVYTLVGDTEISCQASGTWTGDPPTCQCVDPPDLANGNITFASDMSTAEYTCNLNYTLSGSASRTCQEDGTGWIGSDPTCSLCESLSLPASGTVTPTTDGTQTTAEYTCDVGSTINGLQILTCSDTGAWDDVQTTCAVCDTKTDPTDGLVTVDTNGTVTTATFECLVGTALKGDVTVTCGSDGNWDVSDPECVSCPTLTDPPSGSVIESTNGTVSNAVYTCENGYYVTEPSTRYCEITGSWTYSEPLCICDIPLAPDNGGVGLSGDLMTATFTCIAGYTLSGSETATCLTTGAGWDVTVPDCVRCSTPADPDSGTVTLSTNDTTTFANYECVTGYQLNGTEAIACDSTGTWLEDPPVCNCRSPTAPSNGEVTISADLTTATYGCDIRYSLSGVSERHCQTDGLEWDGSDPVCFPCSSLDNPAGTSINMTTDGTSTMVTFKCDVDYSMVGSATITCLSNGGWDFANPTCQVCDTLTQPPGGEFNLVSDGETTEALFTCEAGYTLSGSANLSCRAADGSYDAVQPECVECTPTATDPASGLVAVTTDGYTSTAQFSCSAGYEITGTALLTCDTDGLWDNTEPICDCVIPSVPDFGQQEVSADRLTVTVTCDAGYTLYGSAVRGCQQDGSGWNDTDPTCQTCELLVTPANGNFTVVTDGVSTTATVSCDAGYTVDGPVVLTCQDDGTWDLTEPTCPGCSTQAAPGGGTVTLATNGTVSTTTFACDLGYAMEGSDVLTCLSTGAWDISDAPTCSQCGSLNAPTSGEIATSTDGINTVAVFTCDSSYSLVGNSSLTCSSPGIWDFVEPQCHCDAPPTITDGAVSSDGLTVTYTCDQGYSMLGLSTRTCAPDGSWWNGTNPTCTKCLDLSTIVDGTEETQTDGISTTNNYTCPVDYTLSGSSLLTCQPDGSWDYAVPSCVGCDALTTPVSGAVVTETDGTTTTATYTCSSGYDVFGVAVSECLTNGTWTSVAPTCVCTPPVIPSNGNAVLSADNMTISYTCDGGYSLSGSKTITCQTDGSGWDVVEPSCVMCEALVISAGVTRETSTDGYTTTTNFTCERGSTLVGASELTCRDDGTWDAGAAPTCVDCPVLDMPADGLVTVSTDGLTSVATYTCDTGFTLNGAAQITCRSDGNWNVTAPTCASCDTLATVTSSTMNETTDGEITRVQYTCVAGYYLDGDSLITCNSNGVWDFLEPECLCDAPTTPDAGTVTISTVDRTATYACAAGYTLSGNVVRNCLTDGTGWDGVNSTCEKCQDLTALALGTNTTSTNGTQTQMTFTCDVGSTMDGPATITCDDTGAWDNSMPQCVSCSTLTDPDGGLVSVTTDDITTTATFSCDNSYTLSGSIELVCQTDGSWSAAFAPTCELCSTPPDPTSGSITVQTNGTVSIATTVCEPLYETLEGIDVLYCRTDGTWDQANPLCVCSDPLSLPNGNFTVSSDRSTLQYTCLEGFTMDGGSSATCATDGSGWDASAPTCVPCESDPSNPDSVPATTSTDGETTIITYSCPSSSTMVGTPVLSCTTTGEWDGSAPTCSDCPSITDPTNGNQTISSDGLTSTVTYTCADGYDLIGDSQGTCLEDGTWNVTTPTCACGDPTAPVDGAVSADGNFAFYNCSVGYTMDGISISVCNSDGTGWSSVAPTCVQCTTVTQPTGGNIVFDTDGTTTTATFTCSVGYTLDGVTVQTCNSDGTWNLSPPSCGVICPTRVSPLGGSVNMTTDGLTTTSAYTCEVGYTMAGEPLLSCRSDGTWDYSEPTCESCPTLTTPDSGSLVQSTDTETTTAMFSCDNGYYVDGSANITCLSSGSWDADQPTCVCDPPAIPDNGQTTVSTTTVNYTCNVDFTISGVTQRVCQTGGAGWTDADPVCTPCTPLTAPDNGAITTSSNGTATTVEVTCDLHYSMLGVYTYECSADGSWAESIPECKPCSALSTPTNGTMDTLTNGTTTYAELTCLSGTTLSGSFLVTCDAGVWDSVEPTCVMCPGVSDPVNGEIAQVTDGTTTTVEYACSSGYHLEGQVTLTCQETGDWDAAYPECACDSPVVPDNGTITLSPDGMSITYTCATGYTISGSATRTCSSFGIGWDGTDPICSECDALDSLSGGNLTVTTDGTTSYVTYTCNLWSTLSGSSVYSCRSDGTWNDSVPICEPCSPPTDPSFGTGTAETDGLVTTVTYKCESGYVLKGTSTISCTVSGLWDNDPPTCVGCPAQADPVNGYVTTQTNGTVTIADFECESAYELVGEAQLSCTTDGYWSGLSPTCECKIFITPENGAVNVSADGTTAYYTCSEGFTLSGDATVTCEIVTGSSTFTTPVCVSCETLTTPSGGTITQSTDGTVTSAIVTCDIGYTIVGNGSMTCRSDGTWDVTPAPCQTCDTLSVPPNGNVTFISDGSVTTATLSCDLGYSMSGTADLTCRSTGSWDIIEPDCTKCQSLTDSTSMTIVYSTDGTTTAADFSCPIGYYRDGVSSLSCGSDGIWNDTEPMCKCEPPTTPSNGTVTTDGLTMSYTCQLGYTISGLSTRTCQTDGTGWDGTDPTCEDCPVSDPTDGQMTITSDGTTTYADFTCDLSSSIQGSVTATCLSNGTWNVDIPTCTPCNALSVVNNSGDSMSTDGLASSVSFTCDSAYRLIGASSMTCQSDGTWNDTVPVCYCELLASPADGEATISDDYLQVDYTCAVGYSLLGNASRTCLLDGTGWQGDPPTCVTCDTLVPSDGMTISLVTGGTDTVASVSCGAGFTIKGEYELTCLAEDGTWNVSLPECVSCPNITDPSSGSVFVISDNFTSTAVYTCVQDYHIVGNDVMTCNSTGLWNDVPPVCRCDTPTAPVNGSVEADGSYVKYFCDTGLTLSGVTTHTCQDGGLGWDDATPICVECLSVTPSNNGSYTFTTNGTHTKAVFECETGYTLNGDTMATCGDDGVWDVPPPICVSCANMTSPSSGSIELTTNGQSTFAQFSCVTGYETSSTSLLECQPDGSWDVDPPVCVCLSLSTPANGNVTFKSDGFEAEYTCGAGYTLNGTVTRACQDNGSGWDSEEPTCVLCDPTTETDAMTITLTTDGVDTSAVYTCEEGATLVGTSVATCYPNGTWSLSQDPPTCVTCPTLTSTDSGTLNLTTDGLVSTAGFTCPSGYYQLGQADLTCQENGTWTGEAPTCECTDEATTNGVTVTLSPDLLTTTYTCDVGYTLDGVTTRTCQTDGSGWSGTAPTCTRIGSDTASTAVLLGLALLFAILCLLLLIALIIVSRRYYRLYMDTRGLKRLMYTGGEQPAKFEPPNIMDERQKRGLDALEKVIFYSSATPTAPIGHHRSIFDMGDRTKSTITTRSTSRNNIKTPIPDAPWSHMNKKPTIRPSFKSKPPRPRTTPVLNNSNILAGKQNGKVRTDSESHSQTPSPMSTPSPEVRDTTLPQQIVTPALPQQILTPRGPTDMEPSEPRQSSPISPSSSDSSIKLLPRRQNMRRPSAKRIYKASDRYIPTDTSNGTNGVVTMSSIELYDGTSDSHE